MLSTVDQFKDNCPALTLRTSNITDSDIITIINVSDDIVILDLANIYDVSVITADVKVFNLLSQYKSAEMGLAKYYGMSTRDSKNMSDVDWWRQVYNKVLHRLIKGLVIYDKDGNAIQRVNKLSVDTQEVTEIRTYEEPETALESN